MASFDGIPVDVDVEVNVPTMTIVYIGLALLCAILLSQVLVYVINTKIIK